MKKLNAGYLQHTDRSSKTNKCTSTAEKSHKSRFKNTVCVSRSSLRSVNVYSCHRTAVFSVPQQFQLLQYGIFFLISTFRGPLHLQSGKDIKTLRKKILNVDMWHHVTGTRTKINTRCLFAYCAVVLHTDWLRAAKTNTWTVTARPYRFMWLLQPSPDYLSPFYGSCFQARATRGRLDPESNLCSRNGRYSGAEYRDRLSTCYAIFKTSEHYIHVTQAHRSLTTRQYLQSLIKSAFDRTLRDKGRGQLPVGLCTMSSDLNVNPEVSQRGSRRRAL